MSIKKEPEKNGKQQNRVTIIVDVAPEMLKAGTKTIKNVVLTMMRAANLKNAELSITFVSKERMQYINLKYRNEDHPTDVLSFPLIREMKEADNEPLELGDIIINVEAITSQAKDYKHSEEDEILILLAHGLSHLLGYTHYIAKDTDTMKTFEQNLINSVKKDKNGLITRTKE